jgi:hypothetical protein
MQWVILEAYLVVFARDTHSTTSLTIRFPPFEEFGSLLGLMFGSFVILAYNVFTKKIASFFCLF